MKPRSMTNTNGLGRVTCQRTPASSNDSPGEYSRTGCACVDITGVRVKQRPAFAKEEALDWGCFRSGNVTISGCSYEPPKPEKLDAVWETVLKQLEGFNDIYDCAISLFLQIARSQFFWDVNKRTGRFMMNGVLLSKGYPIINVPVKRQQEFNTLMLEFYETNEMKPMNVFLRSCIHERIIGNFVS